MLTYDRDTYTSLHRDGDTVQKKHEPEESYPSRGMTRKSRQSGITTESTASGRRLETGTDHWLPGWEEERAKRSIKTKIVVFILFY